MSRAIPGTLALSFLVLLALGWAQAGAAGHGRFGIPATADELIVVSSPTYDPAAPGYLAELRAYRRPSPGSPWRLAWGPWTAGCVALPQSRLLDLLRWLRPAAHPVIEIGTDREVASTPPSMPAG